MGIEYTSAKRQRKRERQPQEQYRPSPTQQVRRNHPFKQRRNREEDQREKSESNGRVPMCPKQIRPLTYPFPLKFASIHLYRLLTIPRSL